MVADQTLYQGMTNLIGVPQNFAGEILILSLAGMFGIMIVAYILMGFYRLAFR